MTWILVTDSIMREVENMPAWPEVFDEPLMKMCILFSKSYPYYTNIAKVAPNQC